MNWVKAEGFKPKSGKFYVVWTNGQEWRDQHIFVWHAMRLEHYLRPEIVRDKPLWVAEVTDPMPRLTCNIKPCYGSYVICLSCGNSWPANLGVTGCIEGKPKTT
jgi:hypothetical protein